MKNTQIQIHKHKLANEPKEHICIDCVLWPFAYHQNRPLTGNAGHDW